VGSSEPLTLLRAGRRRPLRLVVRVHELALYGGGRPALTAGIDKVGDGG